MKDHLLKCTPEYFYAVSIGSKAFEIRKDDREFQEHDTITLQEYNEAGEYTGQVFGPLLIRYILRNYPGIEDGYCIVGF